MLGREKNPLRPAKEAHQSCFFTAARLGTWLAPGREARKLQASLVSGSHVLGICPIRYSHSAAYGAGHVPGRGLVRLCYERDLLGRDMNVCVLCLCLQYRYGETGRKSSLNQLGFVPAAGSSREHRGCGCCSCSCLATKERVHPVADPRRSAYVRKLLDSNPIETENKRPSKRRAS